MNVKEKFKRFKEISGVWKVLIVISLGFSIFNFGINFNLINIEIDQIDFFKNVENEITQILSNGLVERIAIFHNFPINLHNVLTSDSYGNEFFLKDYLYNEPVWYGECNREKTNCIIYPDFMIENNKDQPICFKKISSEKLTGGNFTVVYERTPYSFNHPKKCFEILNN